MKEFSGFYRIERIEMEKIAWLKLAKQSINSGDWQAAIRVINEVIEILENEDKERMNDE